MPEFSPGVAAIRRTSNSEPSRSRPLSGSPPQTESPLGKNGKVQAQSDGCRRQGVAAHHPIAMSLYLPICSR